MAAQQELIYAWAHAAAMELSSTHIAAGAAMLALYALYIEGAPAAADEPVVAAADSPQSRFDAEIAASLALM